MAKSSVLVLGATGYIGKYIAKASAQLGHPTFVLVRAAPPTLNSSKKELLDLFTAAGITILHGDIGDHESIIAALKEVDVGISALGRAQLLDQLNLINAIKEVGHIKDLCLRNLGLTSFFKDNLQVPPSNKFTIFADGNTKVFFTAENDVAIATIKAIEDPCTLNKQLVIWPKANNLSLNKIVELFEKKMDCALEKNYIPKSILRAQLDELPFPNVVLPALVYSAFVAGDDIFELGEADVLATELYPDFEFTTLSSVLNTMVE